MADKFPSAIPSQIGGGSFVAIYKREKSALEAGDMAGVILAREMQAEALDNVTSLSNVQNVRSGGVAAGMVNAPGGSGVRNKVTKVDSGIRPGHLINVNVQNQARRAVNSDWSLYATHVAGDVRGTEVELLDTGLVNIQGSLIGGSAMLYLSNIAGCATNVDPQDETPPVAIFRQVVGCARTVPSTNPGTMAARFQMGERVRLQE